MSADARVCLEPGSGHGEVRRIEEERAMIIRRVGRRAGEHGIGILSAVTVVVLHSVGTPTAGADPARHLNDDGFLMIEGKPRLIIGMYELPKEDKLLDTLAESGFNLVRVPNDPKALDRLQKRGLYGWVCLNPRLGEDDAAGSKRLTDFVGKTKDHPALLVWELPDEALWNTWYGTFPIQGKQRQALRDQIKKAASDHPAKTIDEWTARLKKANDLQERGLWKEAEAIYDALWTALGQKNPHPDYRLSHCEARATALAASMERGCRLIRRLDPKHVIWQNHAPRNSIKALRQFNRYVDAAGCDIYPAPFAATGHSDLRDVSLSSVGAYTDRMRAGAPGKAVWMVLQGFGWRDINEGIRKAPNPDKGRRPNPRETWFMAYDAIVHGAQAILYWGTHAIEKDGKLWADLMAVAKGIRALEPAIVGARPARAPVAVADETFGSTEPDQGPRLMLRRAGDDWVLIAVNEGIQEVPFTVKGLPEALEGKTLHRLDGDEAHTVRGGQFRDGLRGFAIRVYATSRRFAVKDK